MARNRSRLGGLLATAAVATAAMLASAAPARADGTPTATPDEYATPYGTTLTVPDPGVLTDDTGGAAPLTAALVDPADWGVVTLAPGGGFGYVPPAHFVGVATFTYAASDGTDTSAPASVSVTVGPPQADLHTSLSTPPTVRARSTSTVFVMVTNDGPQTASALAVTVSLPFGMRATSAPGGRIAKDTRTVRYSASSLADRLSLTFVIGVAVGAPGHVDRKVVARATSLVTADPNAADDVATVRVAFR